MTRKLGLRRNTKALDASGPPTPKNGATARVHRVRFKLDVGGGADPFDSFYAEQDEIIRDSENCNDARNITDFSNEKEKARQINFSPKKEKARKLGVRRNTKALDASGPPTSENGTAAQAGKVSVKRDVEGGPDPFDLFYAQQDEKSFVSDNCNRTRDAATNFSNEKEKALQINFFSKKEKARKLGILRNAKALNASGPLNPKKGAAAQVGKACFEPDIGGDSDPFDSFYAEQDESRDSDNCDDTRNSNDLSREKEKARHQIDCSPKKEKARKLGIRRNAKALDATCLPTPKNDVAAGVGKVSFELDVEGGHDPFDSFYAEQDENSRGADNCNGNSNRTDFSHEKNSEKGDVVLHGDAEEQEQDLESAMRE